MDDWTQGEIKRLKMAVSEGGSPERIAAELGRSEQDINDRIALLRGSGGDGWQPEPSFGPDEEGDVTLILRGDPDDSDAWVHRRPPEQV